jgi:outer membrane protein TolC
MKSTYLLLVLTMLALASPIRSPAQQASSDGTQVSILTLDDAVSIALTNNRLVKNSSLEAEKYDFRVSTIRSRRLPHFQFSMLGEGSGSTVFSLSSVAPAQWAPTSVELQA